MAKRLLLALLLMWLLFPLTRVRAEEPVNRALLVGCDHFLTQADTSPSSENNVGRMAEVLSGGAMNLENLVTRSTGIASSEGSAPNPFSATMENDGSGSTYA